jgi:lysophospholipase L1-like esterase
MSFLLRDRGITALRRLLPRLALLASSLVFTLLVTEASLRIAFYHSKDFAMEMWKYAVQLKQPVSNPDLSFVHVPNSHAFLMGVDVNINSQGLRDDEYSFAKSPETYRIMMLGDSTTLGWGVPFEATVPKLLERELNEGRTAGTDRFEVLNAGVGNYNTVQEVAYYENIGKAFDPDFVVLMFFINDPEPVPREQKRLFVDRSYLVAFVTSRFDNLLRLLGKRPQWQKYYASLYDDNKPAFQACRAALARLAALGPKSRVLVALLPELHQINDDSYPFKEQHKRIKHLLTSQGVPVIDLIDGLKDHGPENTLWITPADDHPNGKANALIAQQLQEWFRTQPRFWLPAQQKRRPQTFIVP